MRTFVIACLLVSSASVSRADTAVPTRATVRGDRIELAGEIAFEAGKAVIKPASLPLLDAAAATLKANPQIAHVEIGAHSDERGAEEYNLRTTAARAAAVKAYLVERGVAESRLEARGYGESKPLCQEHNEACWARNRRVELLIRGGS